MAKRVAEIFIETLVNAGVKRVYGVVGDSLNGLTEIIRKSKQIEWLHVRHEEVAAFAAGARAHLTGEIAVCAGSCGPGNLHLINGLFDCHRNRAPVLAVAAQIPSHEIGSGYFQETRPEHLFNDCSHYCELVSQPEQMPRVLGIAMRAATDLVNPNFAKLAESADIFGVRVENPEELHPALTEALAHDGPALIEVLVNRQELSMPPTISLEQALGFSLYMIRAVLSGRGDEVVDLARTNLMR